MRDFTLDREKSESGLGVVMGGCVGGHDIINAWFDFEQVFLQQQKWLLLLFEGVGGLSGDGDIFREDNQEAFVKFVRDCSDGKGVHFCMADGASTCCKDT